MSPSPGVETFEVRSVAVETPKVGAVTTPKTPATPVTVSKKTVTALGVRLNDVKLTVVTMKEDPVFVEFIKNLQGAIKTNTKLSLKGMVIKPTLTSLGFGGRDKDNCGLPTYVARSNLVDDLIRRGASCADIRGGLVAAANAAGVR